jgi:hypothetical protein
VESIKTQKASYVNLPLYGSGLSIGLGADFLAKNGGFLTTMGGSNGGFTNFRGS